MNRLLFTAACYIGQLQSYTAARRLLAPVLMLILLAFALRVWGLGEQSLWYDEGFSVLFAQRHHVADLIMREAQWNLNTPLYYLVLKLWIAGAGDSEFAVRLISALAGTIGVALAYRLASALSSRCALIATLLVTIWPIGIFVSQEARMYALASMFCLASTLMLTLAVRSNRVVYWLAWCATAMLAFLTHVLCAIVVVAQIVSMRAWWQRVWGRAFPSAAALVLMVVLLAYIGIMLWPYRATYGVSYPASTDLGVLTVQALASQFLPRLLPANWIPFAALGILFALALTVVLSLRDRSSLSIPALVVVLALIGLVIFCTLVGKFASRYPTLLTPIALTAIGAAIGRIRVLRDLRPGHVVILGIGLGLIVRLWLSQPIYANEDFRGAVAYIRARLAPDERIILVSGHFAPVFEYYWRGARGAWVALPPDPVLNVRHTLTYADTVPVLNNHLAGQGGAWLLTWQDDVIDPTGIVPALLRRQAQAFGPQPDTPTFAGLGLSHYRFFQPYRPLPESLPTGGFVVEQNRPDVGLRGLGCRLPVPVYVGDPFLEVQCFWQTKPYVPLPPLTKVSLRLFSSRRELIVQSDQPIAHKGFPYTPYEKPIFGSHILLLPSTLGAGEYALRVIPYSEELGEIAPQISLHVRVLPKSDS